MLFARAPEGGRGAGGFGGRTPPVKKKERTRGEPPRQEPSGRHPPNAEGRRGPAQEGKPAGGNP